jgi:protein-arginine kinase activator protein McsA
MYYHRYVSFFVLGDYKAVIRDTQHNLDLFDLCRSCARQPSDRNALEHYRPHVLMMQGRARACAALKQGYLSSAMGFLRGALKQIEECLSRDPRHSHDIKYCEEARILMHLIQDLKRQLPTDPREELQQLLTKAVQTENFEEAAALRDQIMAMETMCSVDRPASPGKPGRRHRGHSRGDSTSESDPPQTEPRPEK